MNKRAAILCFLFLLSSLLSPAANSLDLGGKSFLDYYGFVDPERFYDHGRLRITLSPELDLRSAAFDFRLNPVVLAEFLGTAPKQGPEPGWVVEFSENQDKSTYFHLYLREAYLGAHFGFIDLYAGQKTVNWGVVDLMSPLDVIGHDDTTVLSLDNVFEASLSDLLAQVQINFTDSIAFKIVYVPFFHPHIAPIESREYHDDTTENIPGKDLPERFRVKASIEDLAVKPFSDLGHSVHGALSFTSYDIDAVICYSNFKDQSPDIDLSGIDEKVTKTAELVRHDITGTAYPVYQRVNNIGAGISFGAGEMVISADSALRITKDKDGEDISTKNSELRTGLQFERTFSPQIHARVNLLHRYLLGFTPDANSKYTKYVEDYIKDIVDDLLLQDERSQIYVLLHGDKAFFHDTLSLGANLIFGPSEDDAFYASFRASYRPGDYVTWQAGWDIWHQGRETGLLGRNRERDNFFFRVGVDL